jgi:hypothetical protein
MPKLIAPHGASWRGRALAAHECVDAKECEVPELLAHGFRKTPAPPEEQDFTGTAGILPASQHRHDADGTSAVPVERRLAATVSAPSSATLSRKDLIRLLRGRGVNLFVSTDELRALAAKLAPDDPASADAPTESQTTESQTSDSKAPHGDE